MTPNLMPELASAGPVAGPSGPRARLSIIDGIVLRHLRAPDQVSRVLHLRDEIDLSAHAAAGPQFMQLEKKETSAALSSVSNLTANS